MEGLTLKKRGTINTLAPCELSHEQHGSRPCSETLLLSFPTSCSVSGPAVILFNGTCVALGEEVVVGATRKCVCPSNVQI